MAILMNERPSGKPKSQSRHNLIAVSCLLSPVSCLLTSEFRLLSPELFLRPFLYLAFTLLVWSSAFPGIRALQGVFSPGSIALARFLTASVILVVVLKLTRSSVPRGADFKPIVVVGILGTLYHIFLNMGLTTVGGGAASVLISTSPVFAVMLSAAQLKERIPIRVWCGIALCLGGAVAIATGEGKSFHLTAGAGFLLGAAICWAFATVIQKPVLARASVIGIAAVSVWVGALGLLPWLLELINHVGRANSHQNMLLLWLGVGPMGLSTITWAAAVKELPVSRVTTATYLLPVFVAVQSWWWIAEPVRALTVIGAMVTLAGVAMVQLRRASPPPSGPDRPKPQPDAPPVSSD